MTAVARHYTYKNTKTNSIVFETIQANYVSMDAVDILVLRKTGTDPRFAPGIERTIRVVSDTRLPK